MQVSKPKVSAIIPAYNRRQFIEETIESVINQTYDNIEIIIIDDGSTDGSREILEGYKNKIVLLEHENRINKGQSASINLGIKYASGQYIAILDSDDLWEPDKIRLQVEYLEMHEDTGLVYGNGVAVNEDGNYLYDIYGKNHTERNLPEDILLDCYFLVPNNSLLRSEIFSKSGMFDESLRAAQDHDMAIRIGEITKLAYIDKKIFKYRRHSQSISNMNAGLRWNNGFKILEKAKNRFPYKKHTIKKRKAVLHFRLFQCSIENKSYLLALYHLILSGLLDPWRGLNVIIGKERVSSHH